MDLKNYYNMDFENREKKPKRDLFKNFGDLSMITIYI